MQIEDLSKLITETDWRLVIGAIQEESPKNLAILIVNLPTEQGAQVLRRLPVSRRAAVASAIAQLEMVRREEVEAILEQIRAKIESAAEGVLLFDEGTSLLAKLLAEMDIQDQESILQDLTEQDPEISKEVRQRLLSFGDLVWLDDDSIRLLLDNLELRTLAIALRTADESVRERFYKSMSEEEVELLNAEIENLAQEHVLASPQIQRVIVDTIRKFQLQGMIRFQHNASPGSDR